MDSTLLPGEPVFRRIDPARLLPPKNAARETFDETALQELIDSIQDVGIIENLVVEQEGYLFRIHAGHRRWVAATAAKLKEVPCMVYAPGTAPGESIKHHENKVRENLNAAEEARYFQRLLEADCGGDVDVLCRMVKEVRNYVEGRLLLIRGWPEVLEALGVGLVGVGVAEQLNLISDHAAMLMYLDAAARGGATIRVVKEWRMQWERTQQFSTVSADDLPVGVPPILPPSISTMKCFLCDSEESAHDMELLFTHKTCRRLLLDQFLNKLRGG